MSGFTNWFSNLFKKKGDEQKLSLNSQKRIYQDKGYHNEETVREMNIWNLTNFFLAFWISVLFIAIAIVSIGFLADDTNTRIVLWTSLSIIYAIILFFLLEPRKLKEILRREIKTIEKEVPVIKEVIRTVDRPIEVEKPVYRDVVRIVEKPVYYPIKKPKLNIPRYDYIASKSTATYHKSSCRLGKSIKRKYKEYAVNANDFKKKKYKPCKFCITKEVKV